MAEILTATGGASLRTLNLKAIGNGLELVATEWYRISVDGLPQRGKTLEDLSAEYSSLLTALPKDSTPDEVAILMKRCARAMRLKEDNSTRTQQRYVTDILGVNPVSNPILYRFRKTNETYQYLVGIRRYSNDAIRFVSLSSIIYINFHLDAGGYYPTFDEGLQRYLAEPDVRQEITNSQGDIIVDPLIRVHSRWIARRLEEAAQADRVDGNYQQFKGYPTEGSWLGV